MSYQLYRNTTLGHTLQESLDELIQVCKGAQGGGTPHVNRQGGQDFKKKKNLTQSTRNEVYRHKKKLTMHKDPKRNVYINDKLTEHRQHVLYGGRMCVKSRKLFAAWSQGGNILVRKTEKGKITQIHNHEDLRNLMDSVPSTTSRSNEDKSELLSHLSDYDFSYSSDILT